MSIDYENLVLEKLNYNSYLKVPELLELQKLRSDPHHHDEMFFIIIHQATELWFKQILHESNRVVTGFRQDSVSRALKGFRRITAIMDLLMKQINLLSTLNPVDFAGFRDLLRPASGFQSQQFRQLEFVFGVREAFFLKFFEAMPEVVKQLDEIRNKPSIYDHFLHCLSRRFPIPKGALRTEYTQTPESHAQIMKVIQKVYHQPRDEYHWVLLFESMLDFDEKFTLFRGTHLVMVERTIGRKKGTGGSTGYDFLRSRALLKYFPDLWEVRNLIGGDYS
jgi:tryptophan 2,3-dioxygenase